MYCFLPPKNLFEVILCPELACGPTERCTLSITRKDKIETRKYQDVLYAAKRKIKINYTGHPLRLGGNRWNNKFMERIFNDCKNGIDRPSAKRWKDDID